MKKIVKIDPVDPEIIVLKFKIIKKLTQAKIYSSVAKFAKWAKLHDCRIAGPQHVMIL